MLQHTTIRHETPPILVCWRVNFIWLVQPATYTSTYDYMVKIEEEVGNTREQQKRAELKVMNEEKELENRQRNKNQTRTINKHIRSVYRL